MVASSKDFSTGREEYNTSAVALGCPTHRFGSETDDFTVISAAGYFDDIFAPLIRDNLVRTGDMINITDSLKDAKIYRVTGLSPTVTIAELGGPSPGVISGYVVTYRSPTEVNVSAGVADVNNNIITLSSPVVHTMTSLVAVFDFHYIYIDASASTPTTPVILDLSDEPAYNDVLQGWYNGLDRCIGVLNADSFGNVEYFDTTIVSNVMIRNSIDHYQIAGGMNPSGGWQAPNMAPSSDFCPVQTTEILINLQNTDAAEHVLLGFAPVESGTLKPLILDSPTKWIGFDILNSNIRGACGPTRTIVIGGFDTNDNVLAAWVNEYGYSR